MINQKNWNSKRKRLWFATIRLIDTINRNYSRIVIYRWNTSFYWWKEGDSDRQGNKQESLRDSNVSLTDNMVKEMYGERKQPFAVSDATQLKMPIFRRNFSPLLPLHSSNKDILRYGRVLLRFSCNTFDSISLFLVLSCCFLLFLIKNRQNWSKIRK